MSGARFRRIALTLACSLLVGLYFGTLVHELGHGLTGVVLGGSIEMISVFPGIQVYPTFVYMGWDSVFGRVGAPELSPQWKDSLMMLMGSGSTAIVSYLLLLLARLTSRRCKYFCLGCIIVAVIFAWDVILYSTLPLVGLRHGVFIGGQYPEPLEAAESLGASTPLYFIFLTVHFAVFHLILAHLWGKFRRQYPTSG